MSDTLSVLIVLLLRGYKRGHGVTRYRPALHSFTSRKNKIKTDLVLSCLVAAFLKLLFSRYSLDSAGTNLNSFRFSLKNFLSLNVAEIGHSHFQIK